PPGAEGHDAIERSILEVWRTVLCFDAVGREESFFDLGGNSILAAQAVSHFRQMPELAALTIRDLYEHPTAAALAARLRDRAEARARVPADLRQELLRQPHRAPRGQYLAVATGQTLVIVGLLCSGGFVACGLPFGASLLYRA